MSKMIITDFKVDYHRNGVGGNGFHVCIFNARKTEFRGHPEWDEKEPQKMVAVVFEEPGSVAVFNLKMLGEENIEFAQGNSWRGDHYEPYLRDLIKEWDSHSHERFEASMKELNETLEKRRNQKPSDV